MRQSSKMYCIILLVQMFIIVNASNIHTDWGGRPQFNNRYRSICETPACVYVATKILKDMNQNVDPCDNFYQFACGGFVKSTHLSDGETRIHNSFTSEKTSIYKFKTVLKEPILENEVKSLTLARKLFQCCINTTTVRSQETDALITIVKNFGGWPVLEGNKWNESNFDWKNTILSMRKHGYKPDLFLKSTLDLYENFLWDTYSTDDNFTITCQKVINWRRLTGMLLSENFDSMINVAVMLGADKEAARNQLREVLHFEVTLMEVSLSIQRQCGICDETMITPSRLFNRCKTDPWKDYLNRLSSFPPTTINGTTSYVNSSDLPSNFETLINITPKTVLANYLMWKVVDDSSTLLNEVRQKYSYFWTTDEDRKASKETQCFQIVTKYLRVSLHASYIEKYITSATLLEFDDMFSRIKEEFIELLQKSKWMDRGLKKNAQDKVKSMRTHIIDSDLRNITMLEDYYKDLTVTGTNFLVDLLHLERFRIMSRTRSPRLFNVAGYNMQKNRIDLSMSEIHYPSYDNDRPRYLNYGHLGFTLGHEIAHSLDPVRIAYDRNGYKVSWRGSTTKNHYVQKTECYVRQYSNYTMKEIGLKVNGTLTISENIADNMGNKVAYMAYRNSQRKNNSELRLPGLLYTPNQMFWIILTNSFCSVIDPFALRRTVIKERHAADEIRIIGTFSNSPEFAKDFECSVGSKMNPINKCTLW